jgi:hypothetical protein
MLDVMLGRFVGQAVERAAVDVADMHARAGLAGTRAPPRRRCRAARGDQDTQAGRGPE